MAYTLNDQNFQKLKVTFKKETGIEAKDDMALYIAYFHAKTSDLQMQLISIIAEGLTKKK